MISFALKDFKNPLKNFKPYAALNSFSISDVA